MFLKLFLGCELHDCEGGGYGDSKSAECFSWSCFGK